MTTTKTPVYNVQKLVVAKRPGQNSTGVWVTIATKSNKAAADRAAMHAQIDNPKSQIKVEERRAS